MKRTVWSSRERAGRRGGSWSAEPEGLGPCPAATVLSGSSSSGGATRAALNRKHLLLLLRPMPKLYVWSPPLSGTQAGGRCLWAPGPGITLSASQTQDSQPWLSLVISLPFSFGNIGHSRQSNLGRSQRCPDCRGLTCGASRFFSSVSCPQLLSFLSILCVLQKRNHRGAQDVGLVIPKRSETGDTLEDTPETGRVCPPPLNDCGGPRRFRMLPLELGLEPGSLGEKALTLLRPVCGTDRGALCLTHARVSGSQGDPG